MNLKVRIGQRGGLVTVTDRMYKASGGEAAIYVHGPTALKLYHEPKKKMLPIQKIKELSAIGNPHVMVPRDIVFDATTGEAVGYSLPWLDDVHPLLKLFTRTFKEDNNIDPKMIAGLVKTLQVVTADIHAAKCLIVDFNELNVLVKLGAQLDPAFIDTDSYATPSHKATAIMDSVRDRRVSSTKGGQLHYDPDVYSDWFSWAVLSFWLYTNIHPYRGAHPNYKPRDKGKQMDDGISVFHKGVRLPPTVNDFAVIPRRHLDWFKVVFLNNERSEPPLPDVSAPLAVPAAIVIVKGTKQLDVIEIASFPEAVLAVMQHMGVNYTTTKSKVYVGKKELVTYEKGRKVVLCATADGTIVMGTQKGAKLHFSELPGNREIGTIASAGAFSRNGAIYTVTGEKLVENQFSPMGSKLFHSTSEVENISAQTATCYEGCVIQDLLGKKYLTIPYAKGRCFSKYLPQLDGFRVVEAKSDQVVTVILAERAGVYHRFIVIFNSAYNDFKVREVKDVAYDTINFTVVAGNLCLLLASPTELEVFYTSLNQIDVLSDPPFDSTMRLFSTPDGAFFINGNTVHQIKRK